MLNSTSAQTVHSLVLVDGPNIDCVLGQSVLGRQPEQKERPRWDRILRTCTAWFGEGRGIFVLNPRRFAEQPNQVAPFYRFLVTTGWHVPSVASFGTCTDGTDPVDEFIKDMIHDSLPDIHSGYLSSVVVFSHDHGYAPVLREVLKAGGSVTVVGFREWLHPHLTELEAMSADLLYLEYDVEAFDMRLPRPYRPTWRTGETFGMSDRN